MRYKLLILFCMVSTLVFAQGLEIKLQLDMAKNKKVFLAHYYLDKIYSDDSLQLDANGAGVFKRDTLLHQGLYKIFLDEQNHFDFLLGADQQFSLSNSTFAPEGVKVSGAVETEEFIRYLEYLNGLKKQKAELLEKMKTAAPAEKEQMQKTLDNMTHELQQYWFRKKEEFPGSFLAKFMLANYVPELDISTLPEEVRQNDSLLLVRRFYYQQKHFWDYFDYTDERFLYTPFFKPKLETWFTKVLFQSYDSVRGPVFELIEEVKPVNRIYQFVTSWFLNTTVNSNLMGMDALFVDIARKYYLSGEAFWVSEETLRKIRENVLFLEQNLVGNKAPDLTLESVEGEFVNLYKLEADFTVVLIFEPNCSHCKVYVPEFHEKVYKKYKDKGLKVYAIYSMDNRDEWTEFLSKHNLYDWINVWDPENASNFKVSYDARKTPAVYLLDKNKKIIAKRVSVEQMDEILKIEMNGK